MKNYLNFETDIKNLETELDQLKDPYNSAEEISEVNTNKISQIQQEIEEKLKQIYSNLNPWQKTLVARHEDRPKSKFFIENFSLLMKLLQLTKLPRIGFEVSEFS